MGHKRHVDTLIQKLQAIPGEHLVLVAYDFKTYDTFEWVYNEPDIDRQRIVFARDMGLLTGPSSYEQVVAPSVTGLWAA